MNPILKYSGVVALVIAILLGLQIYSANHKTSLFGSTSCANITCLSGGLRLVADAGGDFESDVAAVLNSTLHLVGAGTFDSTLSVTATTTLADTVNFNNPALCINFFATSTATRMHMTASSSALVSGVSTGVMLIDYGACAN